MASADGARPLSDIRVIEVGGGVDVPFCGKLLGDLGADVIKLEFLGAVDPARDWGPFANDDPSHGLAGLYAYLNAGKRAVWLDSHSDGSNMQALLRSADIVVENLGPGGFERLGVEVGPARLEVAALARISDWGQESPCRDVATSPLVLQATAGWVADRTQSGSEPVSVGGRYDAFAVGVYTAVAAMTAHWEVARTGVPALVDVSRVAALHSTLSYPVTADAARRQAGRPEVVVRQPLGILRCSDGWVGLNVLTDRHWEDACAVLGLEEFIDKRIELGRDHRMLEDFQVRVEAWLSDRVLDDVIGSFQGVRVPVVPVVDGAGLVANPQLMARGFLRELPGVPHALQPGPPYRFGRVPDPEPCAAPAVGEHTGEVFAELVEGRLSAVSQAPQPRGCLPAGRTRPSSDGPFTGIRILDLGCFWAGPYATCYLAAFGADVIKVESSRRPDGFRFISGSPNSDERWYETGPLFQSTNLGKRSLTLDLTTHEGRAVFLELVKEADVVLENFASRVMDRFELGYEELREANPEIVMIRMPGFGLSGPWRDFVGFGNAFEQVSGIANLTGFPEGPPMTPGGYIDPLVGMHAVLAVLAALDYRRLTGAGQLVEISQAEVGATMAAEQLIDFTLNSRTHARSGNRSASMAPQGVYRANGDGDDWVALTVRDDTNWHQLASLLNEVPRDRGLDDLPSRCTEQDQIDAALREWIGALDVEVAVDLLQRAGVAAMRVHRRAELGTHPAFTSRGFFRDIRHPVTGTRPYAGYPMRFSFCETNPHRRPAPLLGQHTAEVLDDLLSMPVHEQQRLELSGVTGTSFTPR